MRAHSPASILLPADLCAEQSAEIPARSLVASVAEHEVDYGAFHQVAPVYFMSGTDPTND